MEKFVYPGDHVGNALETEQGKNTVNENDELYAAVAGTLTNDGRKAEVKSTKNILMLNPGMRMLCMVVQTMDNKAFLKCTLDSKEVRVPGEIDSFIMVSNIRKTYVKTIRDEMCTGDIVRASVATTVNGIEMSLIEPDCGTIVCFCKKCRARMVLNDKGAECTQCNLTFSRKIPQE